MRGSVVIETESMKLTADEVDYNDETGDAEARGHVHFDHFLRKEKLNADHVEYNVNMETGKFYDVDGSLPARVQARRGLLTTQNPFYFKGDLAERLKDHYVLHRGFVTDCEVPNSWWRLHGNSFNIVPGDYTTTKRAVFYVRQFPVFYFPYFYKSLKKEPRRSGFLTPNLGYNGRRGFVAGVGYYWAINRSYDAAYRARIFTNAGIAHHLDLRGDPSAKSTFDVLVDGLRSQDPAKFVSGAIVQSHARSDLGRGWLAFGELNYLTSQAFRLNFASSFNDAVSSQTHSTGYVTRHWSNYGINIVAQRNVNFLSTRPGDDITIRKLPEVQFVGRNRQFALKGMPFWVSFDSSAGLERRSQNLFQTRQLVPRLDFAPRVETALRWRDIHLVPSFAIRETFYDASISAGGRFMGENLARHAREFSADLVLPSLTRTFEAPAFIGGKLKHIVEPRVTYKSVSGISNFNSIIRFDETELLANTNQLQFSLNNRILAKDKNGIVTDLLTWELLYDRYFDPTFGGAITPNRRNLVQSVLDLTGYGYLDGARRSSPIVSKLRVQSRVGLEWRADYDPLTQKLINSSVSADTRFHDYFFSLGHSDLNTTTILAPLANQIRGTAGYGHDNKRGMSYAFSSYYDLRESKLNYIQSQVTYNTDCCGLSFEYRHLFGQPPGYRVAFAIANIGTFGTLRRQDRIF